MVEIVTVNGKISNSAVNRRLGLEWLREQEQHSEATAGEVTTSMDENALIRAIQDKLQISSTLGSSGGNSTTVGTSTPNKALLNERDSHLVRSLSCADGESKIGSEDGGGSVGGAGADAGANTGASTKKGNRERRFKCDIEGCYKAFFRKGHRNKHRHTHSKTKPYVRPFCIPPSFIPLLTHHISYNTY